MTAMSVTTGPITGNEQPGEGTLPEQALTAFYGAFNNRDLQRMATIWETSEHSVMDNPLGGISRGWDAIVKIYEALFNGPNRVEVAFHAYSIVETSDSFVAIGRERGTLSKPDGSVLDLRIRTNRFFRKDSDGHWRQVHHHGSMDEPALLEAYQQAIKG